MKLGWRTRAELDLESLMMLIAESKPKQPMVEDVEGPTETAKEIEVELEDQASTET